MFAISSEVTPAGKGTVGVAVLVDVAVGVFVTVGVGVTVGVEVGVQVTVGVGVRVGMSSNFTTRTTTVALRTYATPLINSVAEATIYATWPMTVYLAAVVIFACSAVKLLTGSK